MKIQKIVLPVFLFLALGCGNIDGLAPKKQTSNYKPDVLEKARKERCASSAQLVEDSSATMGSFQNMVAKSTVFGFSTGGTEDCVFRTIASGKLSVPRFAEANSITYSIVMIRIIRRTST